MPSAPAPQVRVIRKRGTAEIRELQRRVEDLERQIHALERRIAEIGAMLTNPKLYIDGERVRAVIAGAQRGRGADELASCASGRRWPPRWPPMSESWAPVDPDELTRERARARELRASPWWKRRIADGVCFYCDAAGGRTAR